MIVATDKVEELFKSEEVKIVHDDISGEDLVGLEYQPLFEDRGENAHKVWAADYVTTESGTGIVHLAPTYGEEDFQLAKEKGFPAVHTVDENGVFSEGVWQGRNVWSINKQIAKDMHRYSLATLTGEYAKMSDEERIEFHKSHDAEPDAPIWKVDYIKHSYPHCHRCGTKLMYRAHPSWFMDIAGQRSKMLEKNENINWFPAYLKQGRFAKTIETAPDWNISRDRFWATAMPVWKTESGKVIVVGSYQELAEWSGQRLDDYHRPWVDDITFEVGGELYTRVDKVMDSWFEAGSMSFAQFHYPFENKEKFEANFPGDFIVEYIAQTRAWFYYMHAVSVALFGENSFKNVITTGTLAGNDGRKMSKSYGNYTDPNELMDTYSADSLRFTLLASPVLNGEDFSLKDKDVGDVARKLSMVWNMYDFFTMYAEVDGWEFDGSLRDPLTDEIVTALSSSSAKTASRRESDRAPASADSRAADVSSNETDTLTRMVASNPLDIWIVSRLHQLVAEVEKNMDEYNIPDAMTPILPFLDDASNWYVRRSRRRFWKSEDDGDKQMAYKTLHYVLTRLAYILAPFTPFLAEELHTKMTGDDESVHLKDWLPAGQIDEVIVNQMTRLRDVVNQGLSLRAKAGIKVRQPIASIRVPAVAVSGNIQAREVIHDELNVKAIIVNTNNEEVSLDTVITPELKLEGLMREVIRHVQSARKKADLNVDDRIELHLQTTDSELLAAIDEHQATIEAETLGHFSQTSDGLDHQTTAKVEGRDLEIAIKKAA